jgi:hypothetical protein
VPADDLSRAAAWADEAVSDLDDLPENDARIWAAYVASHGSRTHLDVDHVIEVASDASRAGGGDTRANANLLREVVGNPFRPGTMLANWLTSAASSLARAAYAERALPSGYLENARLAVLADALEEASCADEAILSHLRSPGPHVRGCWALDLVLGKS